jgi:hypothetical protein
MPGLLRGVARTAVVAGTATAVSGRVQRRQAEKFADRDQDIAANRGAGYAEGAASVAAPAAPAPAPAGGGDDMLDQLAKLGQLHDSGVLTDEEFAAQKARILGT